MPWGDGTGPWWANGNWVCLRRLGFGRGFGWFGFGRFGMGRFGRGLGYWRLVALQQLQQAQARALAAPALTKEEQRELLEQEKAEINAEIEALKQELKQIEEQLKKIK